MSNIYNLEPQACGKIKLKTTFGDIDIELFTKQCPKATRNFVQCCLDGYYNNTVLERVEKDFIAIVGVSKPEETEEQDQYFPDEFHSRLRFTRRGLIATANTKKNENGPKFFFTLGPTPELQNKHTIFGRVIGNSVYSLTDLNECQVDEDCCPYSEQKIIEAVVTENPFPDLVPRIRNFKTNKNLAKDEQESDSDDPLSRPKLVRSKKLSFYPNDEEEEEDEGEGDNVDIKPTREKLVINKKVSTNLKDSMQSDDLRTEAGVSNKYSEPCTTEQKEINEDSINIKEESSSDIDPKERRMREIREQIQKIKEQIENDLDTKVRVKRDKNSSGTTTSTNQDVDTSKGTGSRISSKKGRSRERETIELVTNFKKKLKQASSSTSSKNQSVDTFTDYTEMDDLEALDRVDGDDWLKHVFVANDD